MEDFEALILLNMITGLGPVKIRNLLERFKHPKDIIRAKPHELKTVDGIDNDLAKRIVSNVMHTELSKELKRIEKMKVCITTLPDTTYPKNLKEIYNPPPVLYYKGSLNDGDNFSISIVGTRTPSYYGLSQAEKFSYTLALRGITIVSGMARGIDSASHNGALKAKGRTIAVLGSGLGVIYPPENEALYDKISQSGAVISEFPIETSPHKENFPRRNRIISGFSLGTLVIEAAKNSGSLITAQYALEQNREVFALPGNINANGSFGTNKLIKEGAKLVEDISDITEEIDSLRRFEKTELSHKKQAIHALPLLPLEKSFLDSCPDDEPIHLDQLAAVLHCSISELLSLAMQLEIKGIIKQLPGKFFVKQL
ncbi:MAG: DNA-processing protein DprA [Candidatus Omnitrophota bacterium]